MYSRAKNTIIGFHGCDKQVRDEIVLGNKSMLPSNNSYDWLGHGYYFWENNQSRAFQFAEEKKIRHSLSDYEPSVLGVVIDLGHCLDLIDSSYLPLLKESYEFLVETYICSGLPVPRNLDVNGNHDLLLRNLDCAVLETLHTINSDLGKEPFDSVRGVFWEGEPLYPNAGFREKNHIQICVRNPNCIKGFFLPRERDKSYCIP